jgi:hypothetical protein
MDVAPSLDEEHETRDALQRVAERIGSQMPTVLVPKVALNMIFADRLLFRKPFKRQLKSAAAFPLPAIVSSRSVLWFVL